MAEHIVFKGKLVSFGLNWFTLLLFGFWLINIHNTFELSWCLVCPTIEINLCSIPLIKKSDKPAYTQAEFATSRRLPFYKNES